MGLAAVAGGPRSRDACRVTSEETAHNSDQYRTARRAEINTGARGAQATWNF